MELDLGQVRAFVTAADHGHVGRAAAALFLTQQALSKRIARLEHDLGPLFDRGPTGVSLTAAGERFLAPARHLLDVADRAAAAARADRDPPLRVDVWGRLGPIEGMVRAFAVDHPDAVIDTSMRQNLRGALDAIRRGEIDVAFGDVDGLADPPPADLARALVVLIPAVGLVDRRSPLAHLGVLDRDAVRRHGLAVPAERSREEFAGWVSEYAEHLGAPTHAESRSTLLPGVVDRVAADRDVITLVPADWAVPPDADHVTIPLEVTPLFPSFAIWRADTTHPLVPALVQDARARGRPDRPDPPGHWRPRAARSAR